MAISHKPGISNWNNGRHRNTYTVTRDIKYNQPIKVEEQPPSQLQPQPQIEETSNIVEEVKIEESKPIKIKKQWEKSQSLIPLSGSETNI